MATLVSFAILPSHSARGIAVNSFSARSLWQAAICSLIGYPRSNEN